MLCDEIRVLVTTLDGAGVADLTRFSDWSFSRRLNDISEASIEISNRCPDIGLLLPICQEVRFVQADEVLWSGPLTSIEVDSGTGSVTVIARDRLFNMNRVAWTSRQTVVGQARGVVNELIDRSNAVRPLDLTFLSVGESTLLTSVLGTPGAYMYSTLQDLNQSAIWFSCIAGDLFIGDQRNLVDTAKTYKSEDFTDGLDLTIDGTYQADQIVLLYNGGENSVVYPPEGGVLEGGCGDGPLQIAVSATELTDSLEALTVAEEAYDDLSFPSIRLEGSSLDPRSTDSGLLIPGYMSTLLHTSTDIVQSLQLVTVNFEGVEQYLTSLDVDFESPAARYVIITGS